MYYIWPRDQDGQGGQPLVSPCLVGAGHTTECVQIHWQYHKHPPPGSNLQYADTQSQNNCPPAPPVNWLSAVMLNFDNICVVFPGWHCNNMIKWFVQDLMADNETSSLFCKYGVISCWHYDLLMLITGLWWLSLEWYFMNISKYQPLASPHCPVAHNGTLCILSNN